jgi:hypothetical protein
MSDITLETKLTDELATKRRNLKVRLNTPGWYWSVDENGFLLIPKNYVLSLVIIQNRVTIINLY